MHLYTTVIQLYAKLVNKAKYISRVGTTICSCFKFWTPTVDLLHIYMKKRSSITHSAWLWIKHALLYKSLLSGWTLIEKRKKYINSILFFQINHTYDICLFYLCFWRVVALEIQFVNAPSSVWGWGGITLYLTHLFRETVPLIQLTTRMMLERKYFVANWYKLLLIQILQINCSVRFTKGGFI